MGNDYATIETETLSDGSDVFNVIIRDDAGQPLARLHASNYETAAAIIDNICNNNVVAVDAI